MTSGVLARQAGVSKETLRFYEREGLLPTPNRTAGGYREFSLDDLKRVQFIRNAQRYGFALHEVRELLALADGDIVDRMHVRRISQSKVDQITEQIERLGRLRAAMETLIDHCLQSSLTEPCPIIEALADNIAASDSEGDTV